MKINQSPVKSKKIQQSLVNPETNPQKPTKNPVLPNENKSKSSKIQENSAKSSKP